MIFFFSDLKSLGVSTDHCTLKYALISKNKNNITIEKTGTISLKCKTALQNTQNLAAKTPIAIHLESTAGLLRHFEHRIKKKKDIRPVLKNKVESLLLNEPVLLENWKGENGGSSFYALKKRAVINFENTLCNYLTNYDSLHPASFSYAAIIHHFSLSPKKKLWLCFHPKGCEVLFLNKNRLVETLYVLKTNAPIEEKILQALHTFQSKFKDLEPSIGILSPPEPSLCSLCILKQKYPHPIGPPPDLGPLNEHLDYLPEIGSALTLIEKKQNTPNFSLKKRPFRSIYKVYKKQLLLSLSLICSLFMLHFFTWNSQIESQKQLNQKIYTNLLSNPSFETKSQLELLTKAFENDKSIERLRQLITSFKKKSPPYALKQNAFCVSEVLAWFRDLYNRLGKPNGVRPFILEYFDYKLISAPTLKKPRAPYQIKVTVAFSADSPELARKVHQELLNAEDFVQTEKSISWSFQNNLYHASFYLKNHPNPVSLQPCSKPKKP